MIVRLGQHGFALGAVDGDELVEGRRQARIVFLEALRLAERRLQLLFGVGIVTLFVGGSAGIHRRVPARGLGLSPRGQHGNQRDGEPGRHKGAQGPFLRVYMRGFQPGGRVSAARAPRLKFRAADADRMVCCLRTTPGGRDRRAQTRCGMSNWSIGAGA